MDNSWESAVAIILGVAQCMLKLFLTIYSRNVLVAAIRCQNMMCPRLFLVDNTSCDARYFPRKQGLSGYSIGVQAFFVDKTAAWSPSGKHVDTKNYDQSHDH
eukprot:6252976-Amphidinium_carterae.1